MVDHGLRVLDPIGSIAQTTVTLQYPRIVKTKANTCHKT